MFDSESSIESIGLSKLKAKSLAPQINPPLPDHLKPLDIISKPAARDDKMDTA
jgi:hypothetical protein